MGEYKVWLAKLLTIIVIIMVVTPIVGGAMSAVSGSLGPKVAVIELSGVITDASEVLKALYSEARNKDTKAIVLRIDSPGGAVAPSEEIYNAVRRLKAEKPIVVSMGSMAASGGLYSAASASKIFCQPGTQTGSIGVIMQVPNFSTIADKVGVSMITIKSGALKDVGNQFRPMTEDDRRFLEEVAARVHKNFIQAIAEGRKLSVDKVEKFADGRVLLGSDAKDLGLVDGFGDIYDAAREALVLAKVELKADQIPNLVYANKKKNFLERALDSESLIPSLVEWGSVPTLKYLAN
ncbi:MAG: signal peptide peptidase SppA [Proteobacteria bacterium]|nr:signal peptide peptidase SppA [Pseudomonadota bacterium]